MRTFVGRNEGFVEDQPVLVDFPLRGEWVAYHTPADRVPSHGTDQLGQRFAFDFIRIDREHAGWKFFRTSARRFNLLGARLDDCYGWGESIHAPFEGSVVEVRDGWPERNPVHTVRDMAIVLRNALFWRPSKQHGLTPVVGNHVILKMDGREVYALIAHARTGSIRVTPGSAVRTGQHLADVGHSGNSTAPHLHFQLMNGPDLLTASGLPCSFTRYEALQDGAWAEVRAKVPAKREFIRLDRDGLDGHPEGQAEEAPWGR